MIPNPIIDLAIVAKQICANRNFVFGGLIGTGGFKQVFKVTSAAGNPLALKIIDRPAGYIRTAREVDAMRRCNHPNIAALIDTDTIFYNGYKYDYIIEELFDGGTLLQRLRNQGPLDRQAAKDLGRDLIGVLDHLYGLELVHRDIKPENIMYRLGNPAPILMDFSVVRDLAAVSATKTFDRQGPGTARYSSPEQLINAKSQTNWRSDQFALGVMIYYCCFGIHPYEHKSDQPNDVEFLDRVASHKKRDSLFYGNVNAIGLPCLVRMTEPWQAGRYRLPSQLAVAWQSQ